MLFTFSKLFWWLAQPTRLWLLLSCLGTILIFTRYFGFGRALLAVASFYFLVAIFLPLHIWLARPLEQRFPIPNLPEEITGIIVLGGAVDQILTEAHEQPSLNAAAERMTEALKLARHYPNAKLVFSGGSAEVNPRSGFTEADVAKAFYADLGFDTSRITFENASRNTVENVTYSKKLLDPKADESWVLVTSAFHMPRSVGIFRKQGWNIIPYPVDYRVGKTNESNPPFIMAEKLFIIDIMTKEWVGLVSYGLLGRTSTIFPSP